MDENDLQPICRISFFKYLKCPECIESGLYCSKHRSEVEKILAGEPDDNF